MGSHTTFQQLFFARPLLLETLAGEWMNPPTYKSLLEYKVVYEPESTPAFNKLTDEGQLPAPPFLSMYFGSTVILKASFRVRPWLFCLLFNDFTLIGLFFRSMEGFTDAIIV